MLYELSVRGDICETHIYQLINSGNVCFKLLLLREFFRCTVGAWHFKFIEMDYCDVDLLSYCSLSLTPRLFF